MKWHRWNVCMVCIFSPTGIVLLKPFPLPKMHPRSSDFRVDRECFWGGSSLYVLMKSSSVLLWHALLYSHEDQLCDCITQTTFPLNLQLALENGRSYSMSETEEEREFVALKPHWPLVKFSFDNGSVHFLIVKIQWL